MSRMAPPSDRLQLAIAQSLAALAQQAECFGVALCSDPAITERHLEELQQIDRLSQSLRELSGVLAASEPDAAVALIRLGDLRTELEQADVV